MPYRPRTACFELNAGSALAAVLPASVQAATLGSPAALAVFFGLFFTRDQFHLTDVSVWAIPALVVLMLLMTLIGAFICALYIALVGVPVAFLLGRRLDGPIGLSVAVGIALATGLASAIGLATNSLWEENAWIFPALVTVYALPGGLFYRREVLAARSFSPFAEPERGPA
ncbi:MAG: hypothetical protein ACKO1N_08370 [Erythrobacter sp.]